MQRTLKPEKNNKRNFTKRNPRYKKNTLSKTPKAPRWSNKALYDRPSGFHRSNRDKDKESHTGRFMGVYDE